MIKNYYKTYIAIFHDFIMCLLAFYFSFAIRYEFLTEKLLLESVFKSAILCSIIQIITFISMGLYKGLWRYSSASDLIKIVQGTLVGVGCSATILFTFNRLENIPRSIFILDWMLLVLLLGGGRLIFRIWKDNYQQKIHKSERKTVLIIGAGHAGEQMMREIIKNPTLKLKAIGFIDDDPSKINKTIHGINILGQVHQIQAIAKKYSVKTAFIAIPSASSAQIRRIVDECLKAEIEFKTLPKMSELLEKPVIGQLRSVKPEDLLGREPVQLDASSLGTMINNKTVLISGAGGSIGSELCRQVCRFKPKQVILFEMTELFLFNLNNELKRIYPEIEVIPIIGDVRNQQKVDKVFTKYNPQLVLHAAAYKHVPLMEQNPEEAIQTNILGTKVLAESALKNNVTKFVLISSDKAVNPTNVMGATKRAAEIVCANLQKKSTCTEFITVRFGNVLGSNGSVIPTFKEQISKGGPVTITHPDITRFFMSIPEASQLVLQAATLGDGGEVFVLDMGKPIKILDLAKDMIQLYGLRPEVDIKIKYIGLRPGEKLYEELFSTKEEVKPTLHPKVNMAINQNNDCSLEMINKFVDSSISHEYSDIKEELAVIIPEFKQPQH